jgi:hypothetical protein
VQVLLINGIATQVQAIAEEPHLAQPQALKPAVIDLLQQQQVQNIIIA